MTIGKFSDLRSYDPQGRDLTIQPPKNGRIGEVLYVPRKLLVQFTDYVKDNVSGKFYG